MLNKKITTMKKLSLIFIFIFALFLSAFSQTVIKPAIGLNFTKLSDDPLSYEQTGRLGWQIGGTVTLGQEFYLEPGIFWMKNNWNLQEITATETKLKNDISSLRIPCYLGWNVVNRGDDDRNFHVFGGPAMMIVTKTNSETTDLTPDDFTKFIFGLNLGAGLSINKIFIDGGYEWGMNNIYKSKAEVKSRGFWLNAGFRLKFL
jgi:hypothetical protein